MIQFKTKQKKINASDVIMTKTASFFTYIKNPETVFTIIYTILFMLLAFGIPLTFSGLTRSVFEVNKLTVLRLASLALGLTWLFQTLFFPSQRDPNKTYYTLFGCTWAKTTMEWPFIAWLMSSILSTIFSLNPKLSVIGSYDRWEGLITVVNYSALTWITLKLIKTKRMMSWVLLSLLIAGILSAFYGVLQSLGIDSMNWNTDAAVRVFACINNPVHYCAYMGMLVPVGLGYSLYYSERNTTLSKKQWCVLIGILMGTALIYYAQYLSYSRATWTAFIAAMTFFYLSLTSPRENTTSTYVGTAFLWLAAIGWLYLSAIFNLHTKSWMMTSLIFGPLLILSGLDYRSLNKGSFQWSGSLFAFLTIANLPLTIPFSTPIRLLCMVAFVIGLWRTPKSNHPFLNRYIIVWLFIQLQFVSISWVALCLFTLLTLSYGRLSVQTNTLKRHTQWILISFLALFAITLLTPTILKKINPDLNFKAVTTVTSKIGSYQHDAIKGTARTSMWKSSGPWFIDNWLLGSGLDTIKYAYPKYRRADYGPLEGGHHFTPDRLHNEYLNTLASKGLVGFVAYYGIFVLTWLILVLIGIHKHQFAPSRFIALGCTCGAMVYLGQVLFNFGVVATLFLFYTLVGISLAIFQNAVFAHE